MAVDARGRVGWRALSRLDPMTTRLAWLTMTILAATALAGSASAQDMPIVGLITKTNTNPFFVKMREGAQAKADELHVELRTFAGKYDGDNQSQVEAIEG